MARSISTKFDWLLWGIPATFSRGYIGKALNMPLLHRSIPLVYSSPSAYIVHFGWDAKYFDEVAALLNGAVKETEKFRCDSLPSFAHTTNTGTNCLLYSTKHCTATQLHRCDGRKLEINLL